MNTGHQTGSMRAIGLYCSLLLENSIADSEEDGVTVVNLTVNGGVYQYMGRIKYPWSTDGPQLSKLVQADTNNTINKFLHHRIRVKDDAKVAKSIKWEYVNSTNT